MHLKCSAPLEAVFFSARALTFTRTTTTSTVITTSTSTVITTTTTLHLSQLLLRSIALPSRPTSTAITIPTTSTAATISTTANVCEIYLTCM